MGTMKGDFMNTCLSRGKEILSENRKASPNHHHAYFLTLDYQAGLIPLPANKSATIFSLPEYRKTKLMQAGASCIHGLEIYLAFKRVKANKSGFGVDRQSISDFEANMYGNLHKLRSRMSSGSYFPKAVKRVEIPKLDGRLRPLGIPTVTDRIAQQVVKTRLEPIMEKVFYEDSFGYRAGKSALDAVAQAQRNCWDKAWVLDLDIKGFFDNIDHDIMLQLLRKHTQEKWILLYVKRWLKAPIQFKDGSQKLSDKGTPQGGVISPLLANLYLHYAFDEWMKTENESIPFERYADDAVCHCESLQQAKDLQKNLTERMNQYKLTLHPQKTKIVYCHETGRMENFPEKNFGFLGFTFKARESKIRQGIFHFEPGISKKAENRIKETVIAKHRWADLTKLNLITLAPETNKVLRGCIDYYASFNEQALLPLLHFFDQQITIWATRRYKRFNGNTKEAALWLSSITEETPTLFYHWRILYRTLKQSTPGDTNLGSSNTSSPSSLSFSICSSSTFPLPSPSPCLSSSLSSPFQSTSTSLFEKKKRRLPPPSTSSTSSK